MWFNIFWNNRIMADQKDRVKWKQSGNVLRIHGIFTLFVLRTKWSILSLFETETHTQAATKLRWKRL